jgi:hypothetical protein
MRWLRHAQPERNGTCHFYPFALSLSKGSACHLGLDKAFSPEPAQGSARTDVEASTDPTKSGSNQSVCGTLQGRGAANHCSAKRTHSVAPTGIKASLKS